MRSPPSLANGQGLADGWRRLDRCRVCGNHRGVRWHLGGGCARWNDGRRIVVSPRGDASPPAARRDRDAFTYFPLMACQYFRPEKLIAAKLVRTRVLHCADSAGWE